VFEVFDILFENIKERRACFEEFTLGYVDKKWEGWYTGNMVGLLGQFGARIAPTGLYVVICHTN